MADNNPQPYSVISNILRSIIDGTEYDGPADSRIAQLLLELKATIEGLPQPMVFKGTLGTGGTITTLPAASSENEGFVYIVITDGTYAGQTAKAGDTFVSDGSEWVLIPSADDSGSLVISQTLTAGQTSITFSNAAITATSFISVASEAWYESVSQSAGSVTITFPAQVSDMVVQILVAS